MALQSLLSFFGYLSWIAVADTIYHQSLDIILSCEPYRINFEEIFILPPVNEGKRKRERERKKQNKKTTTTTKTNNWDPCALQWSIYKKIENKSRNNKKGL